VSFAPSRARDVFEDLVTQVNLGGTQFLGLVGRGSSIVVLHDHSPVMLETLLIALVRG
jgi:hypothetical protein